ncbi:MAG: hypothetical protein IPI65_08180 [Bacteroidetes bacterium]|nr:hypothetical protein [Bacteroidota bacterium]
MEQEITNVALQNLNGNLVGIQGQMEQQKGPLDGVLELKMDHRKHVFTEIKSFA